MKTVEELPATCLSSIESTDMPLLLASYASGETILWDAINGKRLWSIKEDRQTLVNAFDPEYELMALSGSDAKISIYDVASQKLLQVLQGSMDPDVMDGHTMRVFALRFHPTRQHELVSGGWDDTVQFWDVRESFSRRKIRGPHICGDGIEFLNDNKIITASWSKHNPLQLWDYGSGKLIDNIKLEEPNSYLYCCKYLKSDSLLLLGGSNQNMLRIVDVETWNTSGSVLNLSGAVYFADELPKSDPFSIAKHICFCSDQNIYTAALETVLKS